MENKINLIMITKIKLKTKTMQDKGKNRLHRMHKIKQKTRYF